MPMLRSLRQQPQSLSSIRCHTIPME